MKVEVVVLGSPSLISNSPYGLCGLKATLSLNPPVTKPRSCVKVEVAVLSLIVRMVTVDVKQH